MTIIQSKYTGMYFCYYKDWSTVGETREEAMSQMFENIVR